MSFELQELVKDTTFPDLSGTEKILLTHLAWKCKNDDGTGCWPSYPSICLELGKSKLTIIRTMKKLKTKSYVAVLKKGRATNHPTHYCVNAELIAQRHKESKSAKSEEECELRVSKVIPVENQKSVTGVKMIPVLVSKRHFNWYQNETSTGIKMIPNIHIDNKEKKERHYIVAQHHEGVLLPPSKYSNVIKFTNKNNKEVIMHDTNLVDDNRPDHIGCADQKKKPKIKKSEAPPKPEVIELFEYWKKVLHHPRAELYLERRRIIEKALEMNEFTVEDLKNAIVGCSMSDFHMGRGEKSDGTIYDNISLILRNAEKISYFLNVYNRKNTKAKVSTEFDVDEYMRDLERRQFGRK